MRDAWLKIKNKLMTGSEEEEYHDGDSSEEYLQIDANEAKNKNKIVVKPFVINEFEDIKDPLDALRDGYTIALVNIKPLKDKDIIELKRAVNKLKKTCDAINGDIAGFGEDWIVATPAFAQVHRSTQQSDGLEQKKDLSD